MMMHRVLAPICMGLLAWGMAAAQEVNRQPVKFHIEAQPIRLALQQFGQQAGLQVSMRLNGKAEEIKVSEVKGELTAQEALERMLAKSGLKYEFVNDRAVRISAPGDSLKNHETTDPGTAENAASPKKGFWSRLLLAQNENQSASRSGSYSSSGKSTSEDSSSESSSNELQEIVVTAQKREEKLKDVPISISVLSGSDLDRSTAASTAEILGRVPAVAVDQPFARGTRVAIRGVSVSGAGGGVGSSPTVRCTSSPSASPQS